MKLWGEGGSTGLPLPQGEGWGEGKIAILTWDGENRLVRVEEEGGAVIATYGYDPFGRRLWKDSKGLKTFFLYSDEGLIGEFDSTGNEIKSYGWKPNSTWGTDPVFMQKSGQYYFYHNDHLGTPRMMTSVTGNVVWKAEYEAFGKADVTVGVVENNLRFPGQYYDGETGLHYNWNRYYEPGVGRYISEDPIGLEGGLNVYGYVQSNPIYYIDAEGNFILAPALAGAAIGAITSGVATFVSDPCADWKDIGKSIIIGGLWGAWNGASLGSGIISSIATGAVIGAGGDIIGQLAGGTRPSQIDFESVSVGFLSGALGGILGGASGPITTNTVKTISAVTSGAEVGLRMSIALSKGTAGCECRDYNKM